MSEVGRPLLFSTEEELTDKVESYFEYIKGEFEDVFVTKTNKDGSTEEAPQRIWTRHGETPSITGLALFLGFESRQSVYDYEKRGEFSYSIKRARLRVEASYEQYLLTQSATGAIFALKNFGWVDNKAVDLTTKGDSMHKPKDLSVLSDEELKAMAAIQRKLNAE